MRPTTTALLLFCAIATPVAAQQSPSDVTQAQIAEYKTVAQKACQAGGQKQGDPQEKIDRFCSCLMGVLNEGMREEDWQRVYLFSQKGQGEAEMKILAPHMKKLDVCRVQP